MGHKKKVLIIDDEADFCFIFKTYLSKKGCETFIANSLNKGIEILESVVPDVIFLDNNLPDGYGWEKIDYITTKYPGVKLNLISAYKQTITPGTKKEVNIWEKPLDLRMVDNYLQQNSVA